jgi:hypothetical protein
MGFETKRGHRWLVFAMFAGLALATSPARAERPNAGSHNEGICEVLADASPGLESLCVNYCEARDCTNADDSECDALLANYDRHRAAGDPEMPCLVSCPCFTAADIRDHPAELTLCYQWTDPSIFSALVDETDLNGVGAGINVSGGFYSCLYSDFTTAFPVVDLRIVSPAEAQVCVDLVDAEIAARELSCD